jgi:uncharacterized protein YggE
MSHWRSWGSACVLLAGSLLMLGSLGAQSALAADTDKGERTVVISATGSVKAEPDIARISVGVVTEADTAKEAFARNSAAMAKLLDGLKRVTAASDIQTTSVTLTPRYTQPRDGRAPAIDGHRAANTVRLTVRDVKRLGEVLEQAAALGANQTYNISFEVANAERLKDEARKQAMENARKRAELYAKAAGAELGPALRIAETVGDLRGFNSGGFPGGVRFGAAAPIEAGTQDLEVAVHVVYALQ